VNRALRGQTATLERLRVDRQLEDALTHGPDPLHLAAVFGIDQKTTTVQDPAPILVTGPYQHADHFFAQIVGAGPGLL
jgi:hypothetical protein